RRCRSRPAPPSRATSGASPPLRSAGGAATGNPRGSSTSPSPPRAAPSSFASRRPVERGGRRLHPRAPRSRAPRRAPRPPPERAPAGGARAGLPPGGDRSRSRVEPLEDGLLSVKAVLGLPEDHRLLRLDDLVAH